MPRNTSSSSSPPSSSSSSSSSSSCLTLKSARPDDHGSSSSYIFLVQHLIEKCLVLKMDKERCVNALSTHADIDPLITTTVWNELVKENQEFFHSYFAEIKERSDVEDVKLHEYLSPPKAG